jgi:hypothetical protein
MEPFETNGSAAEGWRVRADYDVRYIAPTTMEPQTCTAHIIDGRAQIRAPGQDGETAAASGASGEARPVQLRSTDDAAFIMKNAQKIITVPGYDMAVASNLSRAYRCGLIVKRCKQWRQISAIDGVHR